MNPKISAQVVISFLGKWLWSGAVVWFLVIPAGKKSLYHLAVCYTCFRTGNLISFYACLNVLGFVLNMWFVFPVLKPLYLNRFHGKEASVMLKEMPSSELVGAYFALVWCYYPAQLPTFFDVLKTTYTVKTATSIPRRMLGGPPVSPPNYGPPVWHDRSLLLPSGNGSNLPALEGVQEKLPGLLSLLD